MLGFLRQLVFLCCFVSYALAAEKTLAEYGKDAKGLTKRAIDLAAMGRIEEALPFFEKAAEVDSKNPKMHNNLGVGYMRLNKFSKARSAFNTALDLASDNREAKLNLEELKKQEGAAKTKRRKDPDEDEDDDDDDENDEKGEQASKPGVTKDRKAKEFKPKHIFVKPAHIHPKPRKPFPRISIEDFYKKENAIYANGEKPFILTNAMTNWPALKKWTLDWFSRSFPSSIMDFYPHNMAKHDTHPYLVNFPEALSELITPSGKYPLDPYNPGSYIQWNVNLHDWSRLLQDMDLPYMFRRDEQWLEVLPEKLQEEYTKKVHWRMVLIGTRGAGMFIHQDVLRTSSWQAVVSGGKRWFICAPSENQYLYRAGKVDAWNPDYETYPLFAQADCYEGEVWKGDMIYYPADYWHQTENLETPTICASSTIGDELNYELIMAELKNECKFKKFNWDFSNELCEGLPAVFDFWTNRFGKQDRGACSLNEKAGKDEL
jgi:hypothetical protein